MALSSKFLTDLVSKLPEASRGSVIAAFETAEAADAVKFAEDGAKRQSDYSRHMDEVAQEKARLEQHARQLNDWYATAKPLLDLGTQAHAAGWKPGQADPDPDPTPSPTKVELPPDLVRKADVETLLNEREQGAAAFFSRLNIMSQRHLQQFGEILDTDALLADPRLGKNGVGLEQLYTLKFGERLQAKAKEAEDQRINAEVDKRVKEQLRAAGSRPPYPVGSVDPSPLDALTKKPDSSEFSPAAMADEYADLVSKKVGVGV